MRRLAILLCLGLASFKQAAVAATPPSIFELQTNVGTITFKVDYTKAPISANNFYKYIQSGFYKNTLFHRSIKDFVVQGGGYSRFDGKLKTTLAAIVNESKNGLSNKTGTIAMARTSDPNSATSQFFVNLTDNLFLDYASASSPGYAVFGSVIDGMDVVGKIANSATYNDLPFTGFPSLVYIQNVFSSYALNSNVSLTRITLNGSGTVTSSPAGLNCGTACVLSQPVLGKVILTATSASGFSFTGWTGDCQGFNRTITLDTLKGNHNCMATFTKDSTVAQ